MPANILEWVALLGINVVSGILVGLLIRRIVPALIAVAILLIFNPLIVYYLPPLFAGRDLSEYHSWAGLILPKIFLQGIPLVLVSASVAFLVRQYVSRKAKS